MVVWGGKYNHAPYGGKKKQITSVLEITGLSHPEI
jgi:hypothetical protein